MRGTFIHGKGMYEGHETEIIFTIAERKDMPRLKDEVKEIDPNAFVSTMHASKDRLGRVFKRIKIYSVYLWVG